MEANVTPKVKEILKTASDEAKLYDYKKMEPEHILLAILIDNANVCINIMHDMKTDIDGLFNEVSDYLNTNNITPIIFKRPLDKIPPSDLTKQILKESIGISVFWGSPNVDVQHILLSILSNPCAAQDMLMKFGVTPMTFPKGLKDKNFKPKLIMKELDEQDPDLSNLKKKKDSKTPVLDNFCRDITKMAEDGRIDVIVGRDKEIKRVSQILSRRKKNNPVLLGEPGVGKTAIIEGLAKLIAEDECPSSLMGKRLYSLDIASIIAGTKYRGQFEGRMKAILDELIENKEVILFIDEMHTIVGAGNSSGSLDISNMLKPALARGELQVIGATTLDEFRENIEKDGALSRRFQQVLVKEPSVTETITILNNIKDKYEDFHKVIYSQEIIEECVKLSHRYISHKFMPDKAIDIMDECGAMTNTDLVKPEEIKILELKKIEVGKKKDEVVKMQKYEEAVIIRNEEEQINKEILKLKTDWMDSLNVQRKEITIDMVNEVVSLISGVPINKLTVEENKQLVNLEDILSSKVIGQDKAISVIAKSIRRNKLGLRDKNRPQGSYIFLGKSGSGKTYLTKMIAEQLFNDPNSLIRVDMSEYMEKYAISRLIGAPPGYVGYEEGGKLTEAVRRKPYSVILFDEIEKAHPDVFNLLLQLLDEGSLTDSLGRKVDFKNTLIILTSNVGVKDMGQFTPMGFETSLDKESANKRNELTLKKAVKKQFPPEFINRIDDVIIFNELNEEDVVKIVNLDIQKLRGRVQEMGYDLKVSKAAMLFIASKGYSKEYGARPLARAIQTLVEDAIAEEILAGNVKDGATIKIGFDKKTNKLTLK